MENINYKNENIKRKILKKTCERTYFHQNSHLELEKELIELKDREVKIKREIEELTFKPIIVSHDDMVSFVKKIKKKATS